MLLNHRIIGSGLSILCGTFMGIGIENPTYAQAPTLITQQDNLDGNELDEANRLLQEGMAHSQEGSADSLRKAIELFEQALPLLRSADARSEEAYTLQNIGAVHHALGNNKIAFDYLQQSLLLSREIEDADRESFVLHHIGMVYAALGEQESALNYLQQAVRLRSSVGGRREVALVNISIGTVYSALGEQETALDYFRQALPITREIGDRAGEAITLNNIGLIYSDLGEYETALNYFSQALPLSRAGGDRAGEAKMLTNIGEIYADLGEHETALEYFQQALALNRAVGDRSSEAKTLTSIGNVYADLGDQETALDYYNQALPLNRAVGDRASEAKTLKNLAFLHQRQNQLSEALTTISNAIALIEDLRSDIAPGELRVSYFPTVQDYYQLQIELLMQLGQEKKAFEASEASRSRLRMERLAEADVDFRQGVDAKLLEQEKSLKRELAKLEQRRIVLLSGEHTPEQAAALDVESSAVLQQLEKVIVQIKRTSPAYADIVQPQPLTVSKIQQQVLDPDTVLVQYALGETQSYLWLVGQENFQSYTLPAEADIQSAAAQFQSTTSSNGSLSSEVKRKGDELVAQILPERPEWMAGKRLLIVGDGILSELSFSAFPLPNYTEYTPLLTEHEILTQSSITTLSILRENWASRPAQSPSLAILADPVYRIDDDRLQEKSLPKTVSPVAKPVARSTSVQVADLDLRHINRLPYTRQEADNILRLAEQQNLPTLSAFGVEATVDWMRSPELENYSMVHLATSGFINPGNPQLSGLVLSLVNEDGELREDGFLRLHDIFSLNLAAELVVLSGSQTGAGQMIDGEGVVGLVQGFLYAGAKRVVTSLWNVNDAATAELMSEFYRHMLEEDLPPAAALRAAQLEAWEAGNSPYLWAAFGLQGEWQ